MHRLPPQTARELGSILRQARNAKGWTIETMEDRASILHDGDARVTRHHVATLERMPAQPTRNPASTRRLCAIVTVLEINSDTVNRLVGGVYRLPRAA